MRVRFWSCLIVLTLFVVGAAAPSPAAQSPAADVFGTWVGTWEGAGGSGGFEITLEKGTDGAPAGRVSVTGEPTYTATFKTVSLDGATMTATYPFPLDEQIQVELKATFEGSKAKGTWVARADGGGEMATGTWEVTRK